MKPIYFPFTYVPQPVMEALNACFRRAVVYQPSGFDVPEQMREWSRSGLLDIRIPVAGDEKKIEAALKDYRSWVNLHQGGAIGFLKSVQHKTPFFDDTSAAEIRAQVKNRSGRSRDQEGADDIFQARFFLQAAQELDRQSNEVSRELKTFEVMEKDFIQALKGEDDESIEETAVSKGLVVDDASIYMPAERLRAWGRLLERDPEPPELFVTTSRLVFEELNERVPDIRKVVSFDAVPVYDRRSQAHEKWQERLLEDLKLLLMNGPPPGVDDFLGKPAAEGARLLVSLSLYVVETEPFYRFITAGIENEPFAAEAAPTRMKFRNTLIGIVEMKRDAQSP